MHPLLTVIVKNGSFLLFFVQCLFYNLYAQPVDSLKMKLAQVKGIEKIRTLKELSVHYQNISVDTAILYANQALELAIKEQNPTWQAHSLLVLGNAYSYMGVYDSTINAYSKAIEICKYSDSSLYADILYNRGVVFVYMGEFDSALYHFNKSMDVLFGINDSSNIDGIYDAMGVVYYYKSEYLKAIEYYQKALLIAEKFDNRNLMAQLFLHIGAIYNEMDDLTKAEEYTQKSLEINNELNDIYDIAVALDNLGNIYLRKKEYQKAIEYCNKALTIFKEGGFESDEAMVYSNLGQAYEGLGDLNKAMEHYKESLAIARDQRQKLLVIQNLRFMADISKQRKSYHQALEYLNESETLAQEVQNPSEFYELYLAKSELYAELNDYRNAYINYLAYTSIKDSVFTQQKHEQINELQTKYETEQKEKELEQKEFKIQGQIAELKQQRTLRNFLFLILTLILVVLVILYRFYIIKRNANNEKEALLKEIHHRVKNNLQVISSLLSLQTRHLSDLEFKGVVEESQGRVRSMALIHEMLYQQEKLSKIDIKKYIEQLTSAIASSFKQNKEIKCNLDIEEIHLDIEKAVPIGLIINELITNAFKYAFKGIDKGMITLTLKKENKKYRLHVADNGIGLPANFSLEKIDSLGLKLVILLTQQLKGTYELGSKKGTVYTLEFVDKLAIA